jgi:hypothetical protein
VDDVQVLEGLLAGRSAPAAAGAGAKLVGLSYRGLPLGFLKARSGRVFWPGG